MSIYNQNYSALVAVTTQLLLALPFLLILGMYLFAAVRTGQRYKKWPTYRTIFWISGVLCASAAVIGPMAQAAHMNFTLHMLGHLLLGMVAPLLMVLAAPITLILRTLSVTRARRLSGLLKSEPLCMLRNPVVASFLNIGGLWLLYTTDLYTTMQQGHILLSIFLHIHVFLAGFLFTGSIIYIDPTPHPTRFLYRAVILVIALAGHGILSKYIYAHPPPGVSAEQAEMGGMLMYYGGDVIDLLLILILCSQWFYPTRNRTLLRHRFYPTNY